MEAKDLDYIRETVDCEGFDYAFVHYSDFKEIEDETFHRLRRVFLKARKRLCEHLNLEDI
jgi:hypothetical protein